MRPVDRKEGPTSVRRYVNQKRPFVLAITAPSDALAPDLFRVRQDVIVGSLCATVQLQCQRRTGNRKYRCEPTLLPP